MFGPSGFHPRRADSTDWHNIPHPLSSQVRSLLWSPYNPTQLRNLAQPVPNDLPKGAEPILTFEDAFEDLLAVSQGRPLPDIQQKLSQRKLLSKVFPKGEPTSFWMRRLDSQGLLPISSGYTHTRGEKDDAQRQAPDVKPDDWDRLHSEVARRRDEILGADAREPIASENLLGLGDLLKFGAETLRSNPELEKQMKELTRTMLDDIFGTGEAAKGEAKLLTGEKHPQLPPVDGSERKYPNTFDEWFEQVQSFQSSGQSPWDVFVKTLDSGREMIDRVTRLPRDDKVERKTERLEETAERDPWQRSRELREEEDQNVPAPRIEYYSQRQEVDEDGKLRVKTSWKRLDQHGKEVDKWEDHNVYDLPQAQQQEEKHRSHATHSRGYPADNGEVRKPGWFWK